MKHTKGLSSARMKDALHNLPKTITKNLKLPLAEIENTEDSCEEELPDNDLEGQRIEKIIIPFNKSDFHTRLEILLGLKLSKQTNSLIEAGNLIDELYKRI